MPTIEQSDNQTMKLALQVASLWHGDWWIPIHNQSSDLEQDTSEDYEAKIWQKRRLEAIAAWKKVAIFSGPYFKLWSDCSERNQMMRFFNWFFFISLAAGRHRAHLYI